MSDQPSPNAVNLLKELLFDSEARRLNELSNRLEQEIGASELRNRTLSERINVVYDRAGTEERLLHSVAAIIDGALREAEVVRHEQLSRALAPLIVRTIKIQLRESQDEMVDALYPITGRMVRSYVQAEINRLMIEINAKLGGGRPPKSALGNLSPADLLLAEAKRLQVQELFLVRRGSGDLIAHWERAGEEGRNASHSNGAGSNRDVLLSGYISGIMSLSEEAFGAAPGSFRTLSFSGGDRIFVRGAAAHLLAVRCSGSAPASVEQVIDEVFLYTLERYQDILASERSDRGEGTAHSTSAKIDALLPEVASQIEVQTEKRRVALLRQQEAAVPRTSFARVYALAVLLAAPLLAWAGWSAYESFETMRVEKAAQSVLASVEEVSGMPPKIDVERGGRALDVVGFVTSVELRDRILSRLAEDVPQTTIRNHLAVLPKDNSALVASAMGQIQQLTVSAASQAQRIERLQPTPREEAQAFVHQRVIFFSNDTEFREPAYAKTVLDQIARKLIDTPQLSLRVVGYTDEKGTQALNTNLAQLRADEVTKLLIERGVSASRMVAVGGIVGKDLTRIVGPTSSNRRVEFEIAFPGETDAAP
jgi:outer membrane protein OmpA-like peptidoglycan-associated protein